MNFSKAQHRPVFHGQPVLKSHSRSILRDQPTLSFIPAPSSLIPSVASDDCVSTATMIAFIAFRAKLRGCDSSSNIAISNRNHALDFHSHSVPISCETTNLWISTFRFMSILNNWHLRCIRETSEIVDPAVHS